MREAALSCLLLFVGGCTPTQNVASQPTIDPPALETNQLKPAVANVSNVEVTGEPGNYSFAVTVQSPDTGCEQYADWWEVLNEDGKLLYRRILAHSHVQEQPFQRSGSPVSTSPDQVLIVRAHMNPSGYGTQAMKGTIATSFQAVQLPSRFATTVEGQDPQPSQCTG